MAQSPGSDRPGGVASPLLPPPALDRNDPRAPTGGRRAVLGAGTAVRGQVAAREDLWIDGQLEGEVQAPAHQVVIGPSGRVRGELRALSVVVEGELLGDLRAEQQAVVRASGRMQGDIRAPRVVLEEGCRYSGRIDMNPADACPPAGALGDQPAPTAANGGTPPPEPILVAGGNFIAREENRS